MVEKTYQLNQTGRAALERFLASEAEADVTVDTIREELELTASLWELDCAAIFTLSEQLSNSGAEETLVLDKKWFDQAGRPADLEIH